MRVKGYKIEAGGDLSEANLTEATLRGADLRGANLYGANLTEANLYGAHLLSTKLPVAHFWNPLMSIDALPMAATLRATKTQCSASEPDLGLQLWLFSN